MPVIILQSGPAIRIGLVRYPLPGDFQ